MMTNEGTKAINEAIEFLKKAKPLPPYEIGSDALIKVCRKHADWCSSIGDIEHDSPVTGEMGERIKKVVSGTGWLAENIGANSKNDRGKDMILQLVVDDGVKS